MQAPARHPITRLAISAINAYRNTLSIMMLPVCRFYPSCSEYAMEAIRKHGLGIGLWKATCRIVRCHPLSRGGVDPVE